MKIIYVARKNQDQTEGRGPMVPIGYFYTKADAEKAVAGLGPMGIGDVETGKLWENYDDYKSGNDEAILRRALDKLTPEEKRVLGISNRGSY